MNKVPESDIYALIYDITGRKKNVNENTCLYHDLRISGDDAVDLIQNINRAFGTTFNEFNIDDYFPNEGDAIWLRLVEIFGYKSKKKRFTIKHLMKIIEDGHWTSPNS